MTLRGSNSPRASSTTLRGSVLVALLPVCAAKIAPSKLVTPAVSWFVGAPLLTRVGVALPVSTAALVALNVLQNGPERPTKLSSVMAPDNVALTFDGPMEGGTDGGVLPSGPFTPTDTAPDTLEDVLTLRTKSDVVRAWRSGVAPDLSGQAAIQVFDGAVLKRGALSPCSSFITHKLFGGLGKRWRGKVFAGGTGYNRFGGARPNRFGVTSSDAREIERQIRMQVLEKKAAMDPLLRAQLDEKKAAIGPKDIQRPIGTTANAALPEGACRPFELKIEASRLDGQPCLVLDYGVSGEGLGDALWGGVLGMRDEIREVVPGVLVGLGSFRATGGVRNCAPFVLVRADAASTAAAWPMVGGANKPGTYKVKKGSYAAL